MAASRCGPLHYCLLTAGLNPWRPRLPDSVQQPCHTWPVNELRTSLPENEEGFPDYLRRIR
jgi:hypothetical protein